MHTKIFANIDMLLLYTDDKSLIVFIIADRVRLIRMIYTHNHFRKYKH